MRRHFLKALLGLPIFLAGCAGTGSGYSPAVTAIPEQTDTQEQMNEEQEDQDRQDQQDLDRSVQQFGDDVDNDIANQNEQQQEEDDESEQEQEDDDDDQ